MESLPPETSACLFFVITEPNICQSIEAKIDTQLKEKTHFLSQHCLDRTLVINMRSVEEQFRRVDVILLIVFQTVLELEFGIASGSFKTQI